MLLDAEFHCQITDFGSTRHCDVTATRSTTTLSFHFAAPELFGMCATCGELDCEELHDGDEEQHKMKTKKTDVYAFGCLYYAVCVRLLIDFLGMLSDILHRYSLILFLFMGRATFKFYDSLQRVYTRSD